MIHYHGTPITPNSALYQLAGRNFCVSFARPDQVKQCHEIGQSVMLDNGAFSAWRRGLAVDWVAYQAWCRKWLVSHTTWCVIPDVIEGSEEDNNRMLTEWFAAMGDFKQAAPVWHVHESWDRLERLLNGFERVCFGSSGEYAVLGTHKWHARISDAFDIVCRGSGKPRAWIHMLRGMAMTRQDYPFASVDSTDIARNHHRQQNSPLLMAHAWDVQQCPPLWKV